MGNKLKLDETYVWDRQAAMLQDVTAFVLAHGPNDRQPLPPLNWMFNEYAVAVRLSEDDLSYGGTGTFDQPQRGRAEVVELWAAALGVPVVRHGRSSGEVELAVVAHIGPAGRDGKPRTTVSIRTLLKEGNEGWSPVEPGTASPAKETVR